MKFSPFSKCTMGFLISVLMLPFSMMAQEAGSFTDPRDGQVYETVTYRIADSLQMITDHDEYSTYLNGEVRTVEISLSDMPRSMTWMTRNLNFSMDSSKCKYEADSNCEMYGRLYTWKAANRACPTGWHLPSDAEWYVLAYLYGGVAVAGQHLKSSTLNGTNSSQFNVRKPSIFWSASELDSISALDWKVNFRWAKLQRWKGGKNLYNSVRCIKDY